MGCTLILSALQHQWRFLAQKEKKIYLFKTIWLICRLPERQVNYTIIWKITVIFSKICLNLQEGHVEIFMIPVPKRMNATGFGDPVLLFFILFFPSTCKSKLTFRVQNQISCCRCWTDLSDFFLKMWHLWTPDFSSYVIIKSKVHQMLWALQPHSATGGWYSEALLYFFMPFSLHAWVILFFEG